MPDSTLQAWLHAKLFDQVPCNIAVIDRGFVIVEHNRNFEQLFGSGRGQPCHLVYKKQRHRCRACMAELSFRDGRIHVTEEAGVDRNGRPAHYLVHMVPIVDESGRIPFIIEMSTDVTEIKRLQREYQLLFDKVPCYIAVLNREYRVVRENEKMSATFGVTTGQYCWEVFKRRADRCEGCPAELAFMDGEIHTCEQTGIDKQGEQTHYVVTAAPLSKRDSVTHVIEMAVDVTRLHLLEAEKLEAERLAAVGQTVAGLAHGIKNILTGLQGGRYIFKTGLDRDDRARIDMGWDMLDRNIEKISTLTKNLLSFSKGRTPEVRLIHPGDVVREVVDLYKDTAMQQDVVLETEIEDPIAPARFDSEGLHECLANLVANAIDACQMSDKPACRVTVRCRGEGDAIIFEVEDRGCGMDSEIKHRVFTSFFTTKGSGGTGLGLLLTRKIVSEHGGKIALESTPSKGSLFRMIFPRNRLPGVEEETGARGRDKASEGTILH